VSNFGPLPANARLYFSTVPGYHNQGSDNTNYWFHDTWFEIGTNTTTATLTATLDRAHWSDAGGCADCPPVTDENFWAAVRNVRAVGIALGGGWYFDNGITTTAGSSTLSVDSFTVDPQFKIAPDLTILGGFILSNYGIEQTEDFCSWHLPTNSGDYEFYRATQN